MYSWPQELVDGRAHSHLCACSGAQELTTKEQVADALKRFVVLFFDEEHKEVPTIKAWQFVGPSICFCIFVWSM